jgi:hypothetical protein
MTSRKTLILRKERLVQTLPCLSELIRGSLIERHLRCGKLGCHCAKGEAHRVWYLTVSFSGGRTEQVTVPGALVPTVRRWLKNYERWWETLEEVSAINRELLRQRWLQGESDKGRRRNVREKGSSG